MKRPEDDGYALDAVTDRVLAWYRARTTDGTSVAVTARDEDAVHAIVCEAVADAARRARECERVEIVRAIEGRTG